MNRWQAVCARDAAADGSFVYAVTSTGVFCHPSCASRRPRRDNVRYFDDASAAVQAGFRACLRCRAAEAPPAQRHAAQIERACRCCWPPRRRRCKPWPPRWACRVIRSSVAFAPSPA